MRPLLVLTPSPLPDTLRNLLESSHWQPIAVRGKEDALALTAGHDVFVGLANLQDDAEPVTLGECRDAIYALPGLRWVATMSRRHTEEPTIKQLIVERLYDFQVEPVDPLRLIHALGHAHGIATIEQDLLREAPDGHMAQYGMLGRSRAMRALYDAIERVAETDANLLITGPTGTGKELVARAIHALSERATKPMVSLNCAAIPPTLIQSELFGYRQGSFTGAEDSRPGLIESATGGTLFLDEIGEMPLESQASLLRFLDSGAIQPLGGDELRQMDVRIIAATNRDLDGESERARFRPDLYYRLSVLRLRTPPLTERDEDLTLLAEHFLQQARDRFDTRVIALSRSALIALRRHHWPGNVRELRSRIYQAVINCERRLIEPADLGLTGISIGRDSLRPLSEIRNRVERDAVQSALLRHERNVARAARDLCVSRMTLYRLMEKHGLGEPGNAARN